MPGPIAAEEMACFAYCPEQWRLQYGLGLGPANRAALAAGTRHHERQAIAERIAGGSIGLGKALLVAAALILGFLLWLPGQCWPCCSAWCWCSQGEACGCVTAWAAAERSLSTG